MALRSSVEITGLLQSWAGGDQQAMERLVPLIAQELRTLARRYMRAERRGHTLQASALVNEAWIRLISATDLDWRNRAHFFAISTQTMRRILVDAARARRSGKRGAGSPGVNLDALPELGSSKDRELVALDDALSTLARIDPRRARVVELRFFGGLSVEETAEVLKISGQSVMRDWKLARSWLQREMKRE